MKILNVINGLGIGGAEKLIVEVTPLLVKRGHCVDVLLLNNEPSYLYHELKSSGCCNIYSLGKSTYNPFYILKLVWIFHDYDIVHVHLFPSQYFSAIASFFCLKRVKLLFTEHNTTNRRMDDKRFYWIEKAIYSRYSRVICITNKVKLALKSKLNLNDNKLVVIENGVNLVNVKSSTSALRKDFNFREEDKLLIMVAGFRPQKDQDTLIKVLNKLPNNYKLLLVGDGERRKQLEQLVYSLDLVERVSFLGIRSDVYSLMKMSDIAILSSHWEGFGLVAVEAMASGIPLIASNVDGLAQVVEGGGLLFEKGNVDDLEGQIVSLEKKVLYNQVIDSCLEKSKLYDINNMVDKLISIYKEI
ncbi:glycosyltransferase family 4 protein [Myroides odoratimimus]|uniref:glycosyltransferase family 4 protein n=1 Tax=Myroides odoratimimus TaxID=76832 RepID=UPI0025759FA9|nr:glycosyltransferase family 4 protein [Myroides odoratimimus]MDM1447998.1 glycosyltransferase family 4 protein [Myroides odoratimimus]